MRAANALPAVGAAVVLFVLAALVEGYISASSLPYSAKAAVAILSATVIVAYLALGGRGQMGWVVIAARPRLSVRAVLRHRDVQTGSTTILDQSRPTVLLSPWLLGPCV